jgi:hypothetical protein
MLSHQITDSSRHVRFDGKEMRMSFADETAMKAGLAVLHRAIMTARMLGFEGSAGGLSARRSTQLADLMDAVHNIPDLLARWEICDESLLVSMLKDYDEKWHASLVHEYERARSSGAK